MSLLVVHGTYNGKVWGERDGKSFAFDGPMLASHRRAIVRWGDAWGRCLDGLLLSFDESENTYLTDMLDKTPEADSCHWCEEPGFYVAEYQPACEGHLRAFGAREQEAAS